MAQVMVQKANSPPILGKSPLIDGLRALIATVAPADATVLVHGESGTGKELVARALHAQSARAEARFVPVNCGAIPRDLVESELFGHRKGSFTGAIADRPGRFEMAHGGTLFLDEIGDLPLDIQVKLLRVLQERLIDPVGSVKSVPVDVRVVAATHKDLEAEVAAGRFREDLYYRLNVLPLHTPALRERPEDIEDLCAFYAEHHAPGGQQPIRIAADLLMAFQAYQWPGNVRELANLIDRFSALVPGREVTLGMLPTSLLPKGLAALRESMFGDTGPRSLLHMLTPEPLTPAPQDPTPAQQAPALDDQTPTQAQATGDDANPLEALLGLAQGQPLAALPAGGLHLKETLADIEKSFISQALVMAKGNVSRTARLLSIQRTTLIEKINKYELRASD